MGSNKPSLAEKLNDKQFRDVDLQLDANMIHIRTFFLAGKHTKSDLVCWSEPCVISAALQIDNASLPSTSTASTQFQRVDHNPKCFCYSCNRTFHLKCIGLNLETFKNERAPFLCKNCEENKCNDFGVKYFESNEWRKGIDKRRQDFFKHESLKAFPRLSDEQMTDDEFEENDINALKESVIEIEESNGSVPVDAFNKQQAEFMKFAQAHNDYVAQTEMRMMDMLDNMKRLQAELLQARRNGSNPKANQPERPTTIPALVPIRQSTGHRKSIITADSLLRRSYIKDTQRVEMSNIHRDAQFASNTTRRESLDDLMVDPNISLSEKVLLTSTQAQREVSTAMTLDMKRKALPKLTKFKGDAKSWIKFKKEVQRYKNSLCFDDEIIKMYVLGALEGVALRRVQDMIDLATLDEIMNLLETSFGHSPSIIKACEDDIIKYRLKGDLTRNDVVHINSLIQTYFTSCRYAEVPNLNSNMLANHILNQLSGVHKLFFRQHYVHERPNDVTQVADLEVMFTFLESIANTLEVRLEEKDDKKPKNAQVNAITDNAGSSYQYATSNRSFDDSFKFKIRDKNVAIYLGYDLSMINSINKKCEVCESNDHFTLECDKFKTMTNKQRSDFIDQKRLCKNCLLTTAHEANQCLLQPGCGFKVSSNRCTQKHHILLHKTFSTSHNNDLRNAQGIINDSSSSNASIVSGQTSQSDSTQPFSTNFVSHGNDNVSRMSYSVAPRQNNTIVQSDRTVKMFKHFMYGPSLQYVGYSIGDSGAEISLLREDLRKALGIEGTHTSIDMQWADGTVKTIPAIKVTLELKGLEADAEPIKLENCFSIEDLDLPARSLDVEKLKRQFPHLANVEFESYDNVAPVLLIGSPHASCFEAIAPIIEDGEGKPIALKSKLGWSIFGGEPENYPAMPCVVQSVTIQSSTDEQQESLVDNSSHFSNEMWGELFIDICSIDEQIQYTQMFASLVPRKHPFSRILLWMPNIRTALNSICSHCNICCMNRLRSITPIMAPFFGYRIIPDLAPFNSLITRNVQYNFEIMRANQSHRAIAGESSSTSAHLNEGIDTPTEDSDDQDFVFIVRNMLKEFEADAVISGIKLCFNFKKQKLLKFMFVMFVSREQLMIYDDVHFTYGTNSWVQCTASVSTSVLLKNTDLNLISTPNIRYNRVIMEANQLHRSIVGESSSTSTQVPFSATSGSIQSGNPNAEMDFQGYDSDDLCVGEEYEFE